MTFEECRKQFAAITGGKKYRAMYYSITEAEAVKEVTCRLYVDPGISSGELPTWDGALAEISRQLAPPAKSENAEESMPKIEYASAKPKETEL